MSAAAALPVSGAALAGWTPVRVWWDGTDPVVDWCNTTGIDFTDPFFDDTVRRCFQDPFRLLFRRETSMDDLVRLMADRPGLTPSGFIFHLSRCGSTLVTQMLAAAPSTLVASEPGPLGTVLDGPPPSGPGLDGPISRPGIPDEQRVAWLRAMVHALGETRRPGQRHFVIKFDAWAVLHLPLIRQAFPATPWVFLYRDPVEVLVSQLGHRGFHMVPGCLPAALLGVSQHDLDAISGPDYPHFVLGRLCQAVLSAQDADGGALVNYEQLSDAVPDLIAPLFGISLTPEERVAMRAVSGRNAKNPCLAFESDQQAKQDRAGEDLRARAEHWVQPLYRALEARRVGPGKMGAGRVVQG